MKRIYCDFCGVEFSEDRRRDWIRWHKILITETGNRPMRDIQFDACEHCAKKVGALIEVYKMLEEEMKIYDNTGNKPVHTNETMTTLNKLLKPYYIHVNPELILSSASSIRPRLFIKCPKCEILTEMVISGKVGSTWYFGCPTCGFETEFVQSDKKLCLGGDRRDIQ